jgi:hypothetical protein
VSLSADFKCAYLHIHETHLSTVSSY